MTATTKPTAKRATARTGDAGSFTAEERAAIKERAREVKAAKSRKGADKAAEDVQAVLGKIAEMAEPDRSMAEKVHAVITDSTPELAPRLWYGMPAYAKDGKVVCFFQDAAKFKARYATLGFNDPANLDDGEMWPTAFALTKLTPAVEKRIAALVKQAAG
ncbi:iron chaperone [Terrabacter sp. MAHUQ-38]|uniref:iron chaperone n=1 Tax=unclassified Terrabacter TaxID=2630222 RepID=UPI00165EA18D|nr:DUF1801 domain-containing protein [Terrabacter sp. MAHUQ-38]MBC9820855.1 DUF1801 domain-containing protein [Terrabacter sp. MAHUQ-38]